MQKQNTILIYSGGMDSTVLLYKLLNDNYTVRCLSIDYGQKHKRELNYAKSLCEQVSVEHKIIDLTSVTEPVSYTHLTLPTSYPV